MSRGVLLRVAVVVTIALWLWGMRGGFETTRPSRCDALYAKATTASDSLLVEIAAHCPQPPSK